MLVPLWGYSAAMDPEFAGESSAPAGGSEGQQLAGAVHDREDGEEKSHEEVQPGLRAVNRDPGTDLGAGDDADHQRQGIGPVDVPEQRVRDHRRDREDRDGHETRRDRTL